MINCRDLISVGMCSHRQTNFSVRLEEVTHLQSSCYCCLGIWRVAKEVRKGHLRARRLGEERRLLATAREILMHGKNVYDEDGQRLGQLHLIPSPHARHGRGHFHGPPQPRHCRAPARITSRLWKQEFSLTCAMSK